MRPPWHTRPRPVSSETATAGRCAITSSGGIMWLRMVSGRRSSGCRASSYVEVSDASTPQGGEVGA